LTGTRLTPGRVHSLHNGRPIWVRYDLESIRHDLPREALRDREPTLWRYRELLPVRDDANIVSLGETMTPLIACPRHGRQAWTATADREGRIAPAHRFVQGARADNRHQHVQRAWDHACGDSDRRECGRGDGCLRGAGGD